MHRGSPGELLRFTYFVTIYTPLCFVAMINEIDYMTYQGTPTREIFERHDTESKEN